MLKKLKEKMVSNNQKRSANNSNLEQKMRKNVDAPFILTNDEKTVIDFLSDMDKKFGYDDSAKKKQGDYFEFFLAAVFRLAGYEVTITKKENNFLNSAYVGDGGVDLILIKNGEKIAVQAKSKRLNTGNEFSKWIDSKQVKEFCGFSNAKWDRTMFITTSFFNSYAIKEIKHNEKAKDIEWYDRFDLLKMLNELIPDTMLKYQLLSTFPKEENKEVTFCKKCNRGIRVKRWSVKKRKYYYECSVNCEQV
ncbi:restriction endonuclease [Enterococcus sp. C76]|uniref:restriction endonuclease n=1 Tax=Enterococcus TaxID=1350 RepID=UPI0034A04E03